MTGRPCCPSLLPDVYPIVASEEKDLRLEIPVYSFTMVRL
jgi:hypothetical protein